jgi:GH15 family glucan-1,4-alpha-glucosidase
VHLRCSLTAGDKRSFVLAYIEADTRRPTLETVDALMEQTRSWWDDWASRCTYQGRWRDAVVRSLVTLKALTYAPAGGMVAAPTSSLPEAVGGGANWDYRFCWIRDAVWALDIFVDSGYMDEARHWRDWLLDVIERDDGEIKVLYTIDGKSPMEEAELDWLSGYLDSRPVRIGNAASDQHQLDVYGQLMDFLHLCRANGMALHDVTWKRQRDLMNALTDCWKQPDEGIWELRGERMHYTHSKVYAWAAFDRSIRDAEEYDLDAPLDTWRTVRDEIFEDVCRHGFDAELGVFTQTYEEAKPDASLLMIPLLGFLPPDDERVRATVKWIRDELCKEGLMHRLRGEDTFAGEEGAFLTCSFWLVDVLTLDGHAQEAQELFEKVLGLRNDVGLLAEEYDPGRGMLGNFPQALSHLALIKSAYLLEACEGAHNGNGPQRHSYHPIP